MSLIEMGDHDMRGKPYCPSNGSEGDGFMEAYCYKCFYEDGDKEGTCQILSDAMSYFMDEEGYPVEWIFGQDNYPTCTKFWDVTKGEPPINDPNQANLFEELNK